MELTDCKYGDACLVLDGPNYGQVLLYLEPVSETSHACYNGTDVQHYDCNIIQAFSWAAVPANMAKQHQQLLERWQANKLSVRELKRPGKEEAYLDMALTNASLSTCLHSQWGAVLVNNGLVQSIGYNGPAMGAPHCKTCVLERGMCPSIPAMINAVLLARPEDRRGGIIYLVGVQDGELLEAKEVGLTAYTKSVLLQAGIVKVIYSGGVCLWRN